MINENASARFFSSPNIIKYIIIKGSSGIAQIIELKTHYRGG